MSQDVTTILPQFLNNDCAYEKLQSNESPFIKGLGWNINANPDIGIGTDNGTGEGQNTLVLTPTRSNIAIPNTLLPAGFNKNIGSFESTVTQELYYFNWNINAQYGIYVYNGNDGSWKKVIVDSELNFSDDPTAFMAEHRCILRIKTDANGVIIEKYLLVTDGNSWHKWIDVIAAIKTDGFNAQLFPYFKLQPPHFDRRELLEWAVRSPMIAPVVKTIPNTEADKLKSNKILGYAFQFCTQGFFTDGRSTLTSPLSLPLIVKDVDYISNPDLIPKNAELTLTAGSPKWEYMNIYFRQTLRKSTSDVAESWGDWYLYDTIYKYTNDGNNSFEVIGNDYWLRQTQWSAFNYDSVFNTIKYVFDNTKLGQIVPDQNIFSQLNNEMPQLSVALSDVGDAALLGNNRNGYFNFPKAITDKFSTQIIEETERNCPIALRTIKLYVYAGRERGNFRTVNSWFAGNTAGGFVRNVWLPQVGYTVGTDTEKRFGGLYYTVDNSNADEAFNVHAFINEDESKQFDLDFAGKNGFRCYLKGTQYYSDCEWYTSTQDFQLQKIDGNIDKNSISDIAFLTNTIKNNGFFVGVFTFNVPAGKYNATLGRHNVAADANYRDTSTYIMGIANSRLASIVTYESDGLQGIKANTVKPNALVTMSKEMEIDCTAGDVDVWGRGSQGDLFYVFTPFDGYGNEGGLFSNDDNNWKFIEGYLKESENDIIPIERFAYKMAFNETDSTGFQSNGLYTDKNGFFFGYAWDESRGFLGGSEKFKNLKILFTNTVNCSTGFKFLVDVPVGNNWFKVGDIFFTSYNSGQVGVANRILLKGRITDSTGVIPYSNIAVSIVDGMTDYTDSNGNFTLVVHNGLNSLRNSNVYVNSSGNFGITVPGCGFIPLYNYYEGNPILQPCQTSQERQISNFIQLGIIIQGTEFVSLKQNASYFNGIVGADLASRVTFVSKYAQPYVTSFLQRANGGNTNPTSFKWLLSGLLELNKSERTKDIAWIGFFTTKAINYKRYVQWVGNKLEFIDTNGNVTTDTASASLVRINIDSLLETNIANNLSLLSNYQFVKDDKLIIYDNGDGTLLNTTDFGNMIDVQIQGTNYNEAAINAKLIPPSENTVLSATDTAGQNPITLYVRYDQRFDVLKDKVGFWIELYTPKQNTDKLPFEQIESWYPVINGEIAQYLGGGIDNPQYNFPVSGALNYWDTYLIRRNILGIGKYINHPFESPNITDTWGANITSGGKLNSINPNAAQQWYNDSTIKSDDYVTTSNINGLAMFRSENKKDFKGYRRGGITAIICQFSNILFICQNDWFVTDYNYQYIYANAQGVQIANLDNNLSVPHQKIGDNFGCRYEDTATVIYYDKWVWWMDSKNQGSIICDYRSAKDVSDITDENGNKCGIKSYLLEKIKAIDDWNLTHGISDRFDIVCGIDTVRNNVHVTFRPRRGNTTSASSFINSRRNLTLKNQETIVFNLDAKRWVRHENFTPEGYGKVHGSLGTEFITFASGQPYLQSKQKNSFLNFYGIQTEPVLIGICNKNEQAVNILQSLSIDLNNTKFYIDLIYGTQVYGYSYLPVNYFKEKEKMYYAAFLRDMVSYLQNPVKGDYRSTLMDGKRIFSEYFVIRFVQEFATLGQYFELNDINFLTTLSAPAKP